MIPVEIVQRDLLIIGGGAAALKAALEARKWCDCVMMVYKRHNQKIVGAIGVNLVRNEFVFMVVIDSALLREGSRGAHYRSDLPESDDERWLGINILEKNGELIFKFKPLKTKGGKSIKGTLKHH